MELRAKYNSLRMHWVHDPAMIVEPWQVANYREFSLEDLFHALEQYGLNWDRAAFIESAEPFDTPEDFVDSLVDDAELDQRSTDYLFLVVFELWRRLIPEKRCLSIFCDELDYQIHLHDTNAQVATEHLEDILGYLQQILIENEDQGEDLHQVFESIQEGCANDIESFLYEFISHQMDEGNDTYAYDLIEGFQKAVSDPKWFDLLKARLILHSDPEEGSPLINKIIKKEIAAKDLEFLLELLSLLVKEGEKGSFEKVFEAIIPILILEEDFQDLLLITEEYFHFMDAESKEREVMAIHHARQTLPPEQPLSRQDADVKKLQKIVKCH